MSYTDEYVRTLEQSYSKDVAELIKERDEWKERALKAEANQVDSKQTNQRQIRHV